jgi:hypothetical protein
MAKARTKADTIATADDRLLKGAPQATAITENDIADRAYELFLARGCEHGRDVEDWLQAERELRVDAEC